MNAGPDRGIGHFPAILALALLLACDPSAENRTPLPSTMNPFTPQSGSEYLASDSKFGLDEAGILTTDYGTTYGNAGKRYNPTFIATYAMALYRDWLSTGSAAARDGLVRQVDWLLDKGKKRPLRDSFFLVWEYDFDNPKFGAKAPWISALAQARAMCAFLGAHHATSDPRYSAAAGQAFAAFGVPTADGGVATPDGAVTWYEEVADHDAPTSRVLNGHISALAGLWTYWGATGAGDAKRALDRGIAAVRRDLDDYDAGYLSYYSRYPTTPREFAPALDYNTFHVQQLLWLYRITSDPLFLFYALRFARYDHPGISYQVAGSTDPVGHGPDNLRMEMGVKYWSHNVFPTWVQLDLGSVQRVSGVTVLGYIPVASPKDFDVLASTDGVEWSTAARILGNREQYPKVAFDARGARFLKAVIYNDNGNENVALTGIGVHREDGNPAAVCEFESFSSNGSPGSLFTPDGWGYSKDTWVLVDLVRTGPKRITLEFSGPVVPRLAVSESATLTEFSAVGSRRVDATAPARWEFDARSRYVRLGLQGGAPGGLKLVKVEGR